MTPPIESTATQTIATIAFGATATLISVFTIWQGRRAWQRLYRQQSEETTESAPESRSSIGIHVRDARPSSDHIFELSAHPSPRPPLLVAVAPALPEEARLLDPLAACAPSAASTTTASPPA